MPLNIDEIESNTAYEGNNWPNTTVKFLVGEVRRLNKSLEQQIQAANNTVEAAFLVESMLAALHENPVSDFAESFPEVSKIVDLMLHVRVMEERVKQTREINEAYRKVLLDWALPNSQGTVKAAIIAALEKGKDE